MSSLAMDPGKRWIVGVALPAAGSGSRMGGVRKPFLELGGDPILLRSIRPFLEHPAVGYLVVALGEEDLSHPPPWLLEVDPRVRLVAGGATRGDSVWNALEAFPEEVEVVAIHDAARPLVTREVIDRCLAAVAPGRGVVAGWPAVDALKEVGEGGSVTATLDRSRVWHAQTPQLFPRELILRAYRKARAAGVRDTDDAALVEQLGGEVLMVPGAPSNLKITRPEDLAVAEALLREGRE